MAPYFKANNLTHTSDLARLNQWIADTNSDIEQVRKLAKTLNANKIDSKPDRLVVNHVSIFQHYADPSDLQILTANEDSIQPLGENLPISSTAEFILNSTPTILPATREGQILDIYNVGEFIISLQDEEILPGSGLNLWGSQIDFAPGDGGIFIYRQGMWYALSLSLTAPRFGRLTVEGNAVFKGNIYQTNPTKVLDIQNLFLRGSAVITDKAGFRNAIDAAQVNHVHDFTASGSVPYSYVIPGGFEGLDGSGNPIFGPPTTVSVTIPFTITGTTETERQP